MSDILKTWSREKSDSVNWCTFTPKSLLNLITHFTIPWRVEGWVNLGTTVIVLVTCEYLNTKCFNVSGSICSTCEVRQIKLYLIPAIIQPQWHRADKRLYSCRTLIVAGTKTPTHILVIQYLSAQYPLFQSAQIILFLLSSQALNWLKP